MLNSCQYDSNFPEKTVHSHFSDDSEIVSKEDRSHGGEHAHEELVELRSENHDGGFPGTAIERGELPEARMIRNFHMERDWKGILILWENSFRWGQDLHAGRRLGSLPCAR